MFNIPVPISELERTGTLSKENLFILEKEQVTNNFTWSTFLQLLVDIPDTLTFGYGSVELPSIALGDSASGFFAPQLGSVAVTTNFSQRFVVGPSGIIEIGTVGLEDSTVTTIKTEAAVKCDTTIPQDFTVKKDLTISADLTLNGQLDFEDITLSGDGDGGDLTILGPLVVFGKECNTTLNSYNVSRFYCSVSSNENIVVSGDLYNVDESPTEITTLNLVATGLASLITVEFQDDVTVDDGGVINLDKDGNLTTTGDVTAGKIFGDGQGLTNLNLPSSLRIKGSINPTTQGPGTPQHGDVWYSTVTGNFNNNWVGVSGQQIKVGQSFYYFETPTPTWVIGGISDLQSPFFMLVDLDQTITAEKTHDVSIVCQNTLDTSVSGITANNLVMTSKGDSDLTVSGDVGSTLTTKSYVDSRMTNARFDWKLRSGKYILGPNWRGLNAATWDLDASPTGTDNLVRRNDQGSFSASNITATFLDGVAVDSSSLDVKYSVSDSDHPVALSRSTGNSILVYADEDFTYNPTTDTLTSEYVVGNVTGDITGNVDTTTALETERTLWGRPFDGTSNVDGDLEDVSGIRSNSNNNRDFGAPDSVWKDVHATTFHGTLSGSVETGDSTRQVLTNGDYLLGGVWDGSSPITWEINSSSNSIVETIVVRDINGNFTSNDITANEFDGPLTGDVTGNASGSSSSVTGNAATTTKLQTTRTIWGKPFDGTANKAGTIKDTGTITPSTTSSFDLGSESLRYRSLYVDTIDGSMDNNSSTSDKVNNPLGRGDYFEGTYIEWDGSQSDTWSIDPESTNVSNKIVQRDSSGNFSAGVITSNLNGPLTGNVTGNASGSSSSVTGNAATTTRLQTTRTIWGRGFDGTSNISGTIIDTGDITPEFNNASILGREDKRFTDVYATTFHGTLNATVDIVDSLSSSLSTGSYIEGEDWNGSSVVYWNVFARTSSINNSVVLRDSNGNFVSNKITSNNFDGGVTGNVTGNASGSSSSVTGNAATTTKLLNERTISVELTGVLSGTGSLDFDGSSDASLDIAAQIADISISGLTSLPE